MRDVGCTPKLGCGCGTGAGAPVVPAFASMPCSTPLGDAPGAPNVGCFFFSMGGMHTAATIPASSSPPMTQMTAMVPESSLSGGGVVNTVGVFGDFVGDLDGNCVAGITGPLVGLLAGLPVGLAEGERVIPPTGFCVGDPAGTAGLCVGDPGASGDIVGDAIGDFDGAA